MEGRRRYGGSVLGLDVEMRMPCQVCLTPLRVLFAILRLAPTHSNNLQVAPYELLRSLKPQAVEPAVMEVGGVKVTVEVQ